MLTTLRVTAASSVAWTERRLRPHSGGVTHVSGTSRISPERFVTQLSGSHTTNHVGGSPQNLPTESPTPRATLET
jgi:hypothetical protein